jgi:hypothetical protein
MSGIVFILGVIVIGIGIMILPTLIADKKSQP